MQRKVRGVIWKYTVVSFWHYTWKVWKCESLSRVWLFVTPETVAHQAPLSMEFSRKEYWSGLPLQGIFPTQGVNPGLPHCRKILYHLKLWLIKDVFVNLKETVKIVRYINNGGSAVKNPSANAGDMRSIPGWGRSSGEGNSNLLQYSCLGNPKDRGAMPATIHGVTKSWIQLSY